MMPTISEEGNNNMVVSQEAQKEAKMLEMINKI
jgi:hypothetical protein